MEEHPTGPEPSLNPKQDPSIQDRLEQLEREAAKLREQIEAANRGEQRREESGPTEGEETRSGAEAQEATASDQGEPAAATGRGNTPEPSPSPGISKEQIDRAEQLIRQARLARSRGQNTQAMEYLKQAEAAAPQNPTVLEFIGDNFAENRRFKEAREVYQRAHKLAPHNAAIERKWANSILRTNPVDPIAYSDLEVMASGKIAVLLTVVVPGLGQVVTKEFAKGITIFVLWVACVIWLVSIPHGIKGLTDLFAKSAAEQFHPIVLAPLGFGFFVWLGAVLDANFSSKSFVRRPVDRPTPLDNLPYE